MHYLHAIWSWVLEWSSYAPSALANVVLGVLGIWLSLPDLAERVEKNPMRRKLLGAACFVLGTIGFLADIKGRHDSDQSSKQLIGNVGTTLKTTNELLAKTNALLTRTESLATVTAQLAKLQDEYVDIRKRQDAAREKHDPKIINDLEAKAQELQQQVDNVLRKVVTVTMAPRIAEELRSYDGKRREALQEAHNREWEEQTHYPDAHRNQSADERNKAIQEIQERWEIEYQKISAQSEEELKTTFVTADFIRRELLQQLPPQFVTPEDRKQEQQFIAAKNANNPELYSLYGAADYLEKLARRVLPSK